MRRSPRFAPTVEDAQRPVEPGTPRKVSSFRAEVTNVEFDRAAQCEVIERGVEILLRWLSLVASELLRSGLERTKRKAMGQS